MNRYLDLTQLFGESIKDLKYYWFKEYNLDGIPLIVSRTGWSSEFGYELFLRDSSKGNDLYEKIMSAGKEYGLQPGHTSSIRRIEGGMLSCLLYTSPSPRDLSTSRMPSSA